MFQKSIVFIFFILLFSCNSPQKKTEIRTSESSVIFYAKGFQLFHYEGYSKMIIKGYKPETYIFYKEKTQIPDSLQAYKKIKIPIQKIVVTSTTHIPSLEALNTENTLVGFPNTDYISSEKTRQRIDNKKVIELGIGQTINLEQLILLQPDIFVGYTMQGEMKQLENIAQAGIKVLLNNDWQEQNPLGRAEWIKFFGVLYDKNTEAEEIFKNIEKNYKYYQNLAKKTTEKPTVFCGSMFKDTWYMPQGENWAAQLIADANGDYLWKKTKGSESLALSFEMVFSKAQNADFWIGSGQYTTVNQLVEENKLYKHFKVFSTKNIYTYNQKKGASGGSLFFELAPTRPDLVLKDLVKILHPELLKNEPLTFYDKLQ